MATDPKMVPTSADVEAFLAAVPGDGRRADARVLVDLMRAVTGEPPVLWGPTIVGFGSHHYRYASGRSGDAPLASFSPRKANLVVYLAGGFEQRDPELLAQLGPHRAGASCLYLTRLSDVDLDALRALVERSIDVARDTDATPRT